MLFMSCVCHVFVSGHCCLVVTCWERADPLALVCDVQLLFCHFSMWYPGSGVVFDCIDPDLCCNSYLYLGPSTHQLESNINFRLEFTLSTLIEALFTIFEDKV